MINGYALYFSSNYNYCVSFTREASILVCSQPSDVQEQSIQKLKDTVDEVKTIGSVGRRQFLSFLKQCWSHLPTYISKDDPFKCSFHDSSFNEKNWTFPRSPSGLLKQVSMHITNFLNGIEKVNDRVLPVILRKFPHFDIDSVASMFSDQFTNKRSYKNNGFKRKFKSDQKNTSVKPSVIGLIGEFSHNDGRNSDQVSIGNGESLKNNDKVLITCELYSIKF